MVEPPFQKEVESTESVVAPYRALEEFLMWRVTA
jgi:hypothetical protein